MSDHRTINNYSSIEGAIAQIKAINAENNKTELELKLNPELDPRNDILEQIEFGAATREQQIELLKDCELNFNQKAGLMWQLEMADRFEIAAAVSNASFQEMLNQQDEIIRQQAVEARTEREDAETGLQNNGEHTAHISEGMESALTSLAFTAQRHFEDVMWLSDKTPAEKVKLLAQTKVMAEQLSALATIIINDGKTNTAELKAIRDRQHEIRETFFPPSCNA